MADPLSERNELTAALELAASAARAYLEGIDASPVLDPVAETTVQGWHDPMPEHGEGTLAAVAELAERAQATATRSSGPRFFHFVMGGVTPAAHAADWLTSTYDQSAFSWASSPFATQLERVALDWLRQLFDLPAAFAGIFTTGATMSNFVGLAAARNWLGERLGIDVEENGLAGAPPPTLLSTAYLHPSAAQAVGMLGLGRANIRRLAPDEIARALEAAPGPAIVLANAGEVNTGDFDPIAQLADLAEEHGAWLHVDGAFGLFARLSPRTSGLAAGVERAASVSCDGHKWLNVPYDCGFAFVREAERLPRALNVGAPYLPSPDDPHPSFGFMAPENSRRARALAVWTTLRAYGRAGYRDMVERHLDLAQRLARRIDAEPDLERLAEVPLNIVCFRARPHDTPEAELDELNRRLGAALLADGRVFAGTTTYDGQAALRPAIVNWRTGPGDVELLVDVVLELLRRG